MNDKHWTKGGRKSEADGHVPRIRISVTRLSVLACLEVKSTAFTPRSFLLSLFLSLYLSFRVSPFSPQDASWDPDIRHEDTIFHDYRASNTVYMYNKTSKWALSLSRFLIGPPPSPSYYGTSFGTLRFPVEGLYPILSPSPETERIGERLTSFNGLSSTGSVSLLTIGLECT